MLHTELKKQEGHINFWKKCLSRPVRPNSPPVLKIPLATNCQKWTTHTKGTLPHNYLILSAVNNSQRLDSVAAEILVWFKMSILIYSYDSSSCKITWHFKPRNIYNNFRDVCTIALILLFLIALVSQAVECSTSRDTVYGNTAFKNTTPWKAER